MLLALRSSAAFVLALAFLAGPVSAACLHGADHGMVDAMEHEMPMPEHGPADDAPPCHDVPEAPIPDAPAPPPADCASACCAIQTAVEAPAPMPPADAALLLAVVVTETLAVPTEVPAPVPAASPPRPPERLHVLLERYLI